MSKTTIATIRKAINECSYVEGYCMERAINDDDAVWFMELVKGAIKDTEEKENQPKVYY